MDSILHTCVYDKLLFTMKHIRSHEEPAQMNTGEESESLVSQSCPTLCDPWTVAH